MKGEEIGAIIGVSMVIAMSVGLGYWTHSLGAGVFAFASVFVYIIYVRGTGR